MENIEEQIKLKTCKQCGNIFDRPYRGKSKYKISWANYFEMIFCSKECSSQNQKKTFGGKNNPNYKGGPLRCIDCNKPQNKRTITNQRCKKCWHAFYRGKNHKQWSGKTICNLCGGEKSHISNMCQSCAIANRVFQTPKPKMLKTNVSYESLHRWVIRWRGNPPVCEHCGKIGIKQSGRWTIQWANKSKNYFRDLNDWIGLCVSCHRKFDKK